MLTLEEAIKRCEEVAEAQDSKVPYRIFKDDKWTEEQTEHHKCAEEHRQFARWLRLLKQIIDSGDCNSCMFKGMCATEPGLGQMVRYNCYGYARKESHDEYEDGTLITDTNSQSQTTSNQTWILEDNIARCPCCDYWFDIDFFESLPNYCLECGADLRSDKT